MNFRKELDELRALKGRRDRAKAIFEDEDRAYREKRDELYFAMEDAGITSMGTEQGKYVRQKPKPKPVIQDRKAFIAWARENRPALIQTTEQRKALNAFVHEAVDDNQGLPPGLGVRYDHVVSIYKGDGAAEPDDDDGDE